MQGAGAGTSPGEGRLVRFVNGGSMELKNEWGLYCYHVKNIFQLAPALPSITSTSNTTQCPQNHDADKQYQRDAEALCGEKGHIFINVRTGKRLTLRHFEKMIDRWARLLNIQNLQSIKPSGREYHLITLMGTKGGSREASLS
jgi:hypothetical protein